MSECSNYEATSYVFTLLTEFGCLSTNATPPVFCLGLVGGALNLYNANKTITTSLCSAFAGTGCCYASFIDVELPAINLGIAQPEAIPILRNITSECADLGIPMPSVSCAGGSHDPCQEPFSEIAGECLQFAIDFPEAIFAAMGDPMLNARLCTHICYNSTIKLASILARQRLFMLLCSECVMMMMIHFDFVRVCCCC